MKTQQQHTKVSTVGRLILAAVSEGIHDPELIGSKLKIGAGRSKSIDALRRGKLLKFAPVKVNQLVLTEAGKAVLEGEASAPTSGSKAISKRVHADEIISSSPRRMSRSELIAKLVEDVGLTPYSASTYIYNWGRQH